LWEAERKTLLIFREEYLEHEQHPTHPERRERLSYTIDRLEEEGIPHVVEGVEMEGADPADREVVELVHDPDYVELVRRLSEGGGGSLDPDTYVSPGTYEIALLAVGGAVKAVEEVVKGRYETAFALVRPPGHHASVSKGAGFCYFNNVAVAAEYAIKVLGLSSVAILDWDAHHGDGTQDVFYHRDDVLYVSIHQDGRTLYPGTGFPDEVGMGPGEGYTVNVPLPPASGDRAYSEAFDVIVRPVVEEFEPDLILVSAGQDCHFSDPLTALAVTAEGYGKMMEKTVELASETGARGPVAVLEGGYSIELGLPYTNLAVIAALAGIPTTVEEPVDPPEENPEGVRTVRKVARYHARYWEGVRRRSS